MKTTEPQFITDQKGNRISVIVPVQDYENMIKALEELEDTRMYKKAKSDQTDSFGNYLKSRVAAE